MCRMIAGVGNIDVDWVIDAAIMMSDGMRTAAEVHLRGGLTLRAITAPCFLGPRSKPSGDAGGETTSPATISKTSSPSSTDARHFWMRSQRLRSNCADLLERR